LTLAESYLSSIPLVPASFLERVVAKVIDYFISALPIVPIFFLIRVGLLETNRSFWVPTVIAFAIAAVMMSLPVYTMFFEYLLGYTLGKRLFNLRVVRESGARIGMGQAFVRQLPFVGQVFMIDALFALFTDKKQRAFEMASKTRVVKSIE
jgi:uncharacterized RDD family membrane protein YckC